ncbi:MAG: hypothetical protein ACTSQJ_00815 [Promethearchaeota archaeon]
MPKKYVVFFKSVGRKWFLFLIILILIVFIYNQEAAIWITAITIGLFLLTYVKPVIFKHKIVKKMKEYYMIEDDTVADLLKKPLREVREVIFKIYQKQKRKKYLIVFLNKHYIFYHQDTIEKYIELYNKGLNEKEILEKLYDNDLRTRAEVKAIKDALIKHFRLAD